MVCEPHLATQLSIKLKHPDQPDPSICKKLNLASKPKNRHQNYMHKLLFLTIILPICLFSQDKVSNTDLSKKLDLILGKLGGLEKRVTKLESDNVDVKKEVKEVAESAKKAKSKSEHLSIPRNEKEKESFFKKLKNEIISQEAKDSGPWAKKESWDQIRRNLTRVQVRRILGNPHRVKLNLNPRVDQVYHYDGDLDADGEEEIGYINFYRDRVVDFQSPFDF
jgi:vacuolar-type H+-ATPase subunit I/STV1